MVEKCHFHGFFRFPTFLCSDFVFEKSELKNRNHFSLFLSTMENIHIYLHTDEIFSEK